VLTRTQIEAPLNGYQYIQLHTAGSTDPKVPYLTGSFNCPAFDYAQVNYLETAQFADIEAASKNIYEQIDGPLLADTGVDAAQADYINAYAIYDYVNYHAAHNATFAAVLSDLGQNANSSISYLDALRDLAGQQQYAYFGNLTAWNNLTSSSNLGGAEQGSISTIGGNLLLAKMLTQLQVAAEFNATYYKLSTLFADYQSMISMFALLGLPELNSNFYGLPDFASSAAFELFSYTNGSSTQDFPDSSDLWVRFYFRNGTDDSAPYQAYSIFGRGPSETDMMWSEFETLMSNVVMSQFDVGDWCTQCRSAMLFCAAYEDTSPSSGSGPSYRTPSSSKKHELSPAVAGVVGAIVALVIAGSLFGLAMLVGGVRLYRNKSHKKEMGGFKGSAKLASDRDLTLPKGGAVVGATIERSRDTSPIGGHERIGSWELKKAEAERGGTAESGGRFRPSFEDDDEVRPVDPFADPVKADERV
jgi:hypothetical protein